MSKSKTLIYEANKTYFTADLHIGHTFIRKLRNYNNKQEMHDTLIDTWNSIITEDTDVFILGDITFANTADTILVLSQLNGHLHLIRGNHDKGLAKICLDFFDTVSDVKEIYIRNADNATKTRVFMSHYSHQIWNLSHYGAYHLFGHSHGSLKGIGRSIDVGLDTNDVKPYTWYEIDNVLKNIPIHKVDHHQTKE